MPDQVSTTNPSALLALADRCEREEPSPQLDCEILKAAGHNALWRGDRIGWEWRRDNKGFWSRMISPTTSLDAAVTLVPEGCVWAADNLSGPRGYVVGGEEPDGDVPYGNSDTAGTKTVAMALCAAALRARSSLTEKG
jgi:hypothetical protein